MAEVPKKSQEAPKPNVEIPVRSLDASRKALQTEQDKEKELLDQGVNIQPERVEIARKAIAQALEPMKSKAYQDVFAKFGITLKSPDFYLALAIKESSLDQSKESEKKKDGSGGAKGLFQIKTGPKDALADVNQRFNLTFQEKDIFSQNPEYQEKVTRNNAIVGILFWHLCRDHYGAKVSPDLSADDKDKVGNFFFKMGPTDVPRLWKAAGNPKNFKEFATTLAQKLKEKFPDNIDIPTDKVKTIVDDTYPVKYTKYLTNKGTLPNNELVVGNETFDAANVIQTLRYSELIFTMSHTPLKFKTVEAAKMAEGLDKEAYTLGANDKWFWSISKDIYDKYKLDTTNSYFASSKLSVKDKIDIFIKIVFDYNKSIKNPDFIGIDASSGIPKGAKIYKPTINFISDYIAKNLNKPAAPVAPIKYEKIGPPLILKDRVFMILDNLMPKIFTINTPGVKAKMEFSQETNREINIDGTNFEHDRIRVKAGNLTGFFQMEKGDNISYGPLEKGGFWDHYDVHLDAKSGTVTIIETKPEGITVSPKPAPAPARDLAPKEVAAKVDIMPKDVPMYTGPDAKALEDRGKQPIKYEDEKGNPLDLNTPPCKLKIPKSPDDEDKQIDVNDPPWYDKEHPHALRVGEIDNEKDVKYIILHSTEGIGRGLEVNDEKKGLYQTQGIHYLVRLNGTVELIANEWINPNIKDKKERESQKRIAINHAGKVGHNAGAIWNGEEMSTHSIGIEVEANPEEEYTKAQYAALKPLLAWIGARYKIPQSNVLTHSMVAYHPKWGRGRKADPLKLDWAQLGLPDNYRRVDPDVATGKFPSNISWIKGQSTKEGNSWSGTDATMISGLEAAEKIVTDKTAEDKKNKGK